MSQMRYLYVEDDPLSREVMKTLLVDVIGVWGVTLFENSADFMTRLTAIDPLPDFVFLDMLVPPYDGHEMLAMLRADETTRHLKVIAVSAGIISRTVAQYQQEGFDGAISKPVDMMTFLSIIKRLENGEAIWQTS
jgi:CheY-like chemotaxis protein